MNINLTTPAAKPAASAPQVTSAPVPPEAKPVAPAEAPKTVSPAVDPEYEAFLAAKAAKLAAEAAKLAEEKAKAEALVAKDAKSAEVVALEVQIAECKDPDYADFLRGKLAKLAAVAGIVPSLPAKPAAAVATPAPAPVNAGDAAEAVDVSRETALATRADRAVQSAEFFEGSGVEGEWDQTNLILPRLQVVQGKGKLSERFPDGTTIFNDLTFLDPATAITAAVKVEFVPIQLKKRFREVVEQNSGLTPRTVDTKEEVLALGGEYRWVNNQPPTWKESARCVWLLKLPAGLEHPSFSPIDGLEGLYALSLVFLTGSSFKYGANPLFNAALTTLKINDAEGKGHPYLPKRWWTFQVEKREFGKYKVWTMLPQQTTRDTAPEVRAFVNGFLNRKVEDSEE